jgi:hypothetical protein
VGDATKDWGNASENKVFRVFLEAEMKTGMLRRGNIPVVFLKRAGADVGGLKP